MLNKKTLLRVTCTKLTAQYNRHMYFKNINNSKYLFKDEDHLTIVNQPH